MVILGRRINGDRCTFILGRRRVRRGSTTPGQRTASGNALANAATLPLAVMTIHISPTAGPEGGHAVIEHLTIMLAPIGPVSP